MEKIKDINTYFELVNHVKKKNAPTYTNCYLYPDKVRKLITQGRLYYENVNGELLLYDDEKEYYLTYYYLNVDADWYISPKEKTIVIRNIYMEGKKNRKLKQLEEKIKALGFCLPDREREVECDIQTMMKKTEKSYHIAVRIMQQAGFSLVVPDMDLIPQIRELQKRTKEVPVYRLPYFNDEEMIALGKTGRAVCVVNGKKELCAMKLFTEENSTYDYTAIKEEYRGKYGIAVVLSNYIPNGLTEGNTKLLTWIASTNSIAIQYSMKIGWHWTGRYKDEWILEAE